MSKPKFQPSNVLLVEVPPQFIALCEASGASPQAALRGMAAMVCGLQYDSDNRLVPMEGATAWCFTGRGSFPRPESAWICLGEQPWSWRYEKPVR
jgi:hypothetical protein